MQNRMIVLALLSGCVVYAPADKDSSEVESTDLTDAITDAPSDTDVAATDEPTDPPVDTDVTDVTDTTDVTDITDTDAPAPAPNPLYANTASALYEADPVSGLVTFIGDFHDGNGTAVGSMTDIAIDSQGALFGITFGTLYRVDPADAEVSAICNLPGSYNGLTFAPGDVLVVAGGNAVYAMDQTTCQVTTITTTAYGSSGDIVGLPDGYLYWTVTGGDQLVRVHPGTGATTLMGNIGVSSLYGLGFHEDSLYGFSGSGVIVKILPASATATPLASGGPAWWGATTNPITWNP